MKQTIEQTQMNRGIKFAKENIVELAKLIVEWKNTGLLGNGSHCLVHDLAKMLPGIGSKLPLAESIIKSECLEMISHSNDKPPYKYDYRDYDDLGPCSHWDD
jgi:hypothetical protein